ncbi:MAG: helicase HerA-like domain-containing protein, partial [Candidatus Eisenbacteria bacterium]
ATRMIPPASRMGPLSEGELGERLSASEQVKEYAQAVDRESAREILAARMAGDRFEEPASADSGSVGRETTKSPAATTGGVLEGLARAMNSPIVRSIAGRATTQVMRGLMGALLGAPRRRRASRRGPFG